MRVLIVTKIFPNRVEPSSSPFNRRQFVELARLCEVDLLATIPWFPCAKGFARWSRAGRLVDVPRKERIDGLTVHHPRVAFVPRMDAGTAGPLYAASLVRAVLGRRGRVDVVLGSWAYPDGFAAVALARMLGAPAVVKLHGSDVNVLARRPASRRGIAWALRRARRVVAVSAPLREAAITLGAAPERVDVVRNGIDRGRFRPQDRIEARRGLGLPDDGKVVLYVGNVERHKGAVDLLAAFSRVARSTPGVSLVMVGGGAASEECRRLAAGLGDRAALVGPKAHGEIPRWIAACDALVLPSWAEGTPNVVIEALACGRRVVATRVGGTPDVITSDVLGALVPPRDPAALADAIRDALSRPYDPVAVSEALDAPGWEESARALHASLLAAAASPITM